VSRRPETLTLGPAAYAVAQPQADPSVGADLAVRRAVASLPQRHQAAVGLHYGFDGPPLPLEGVAARLDAPPASVREWLDEAAQVLRRSLADYEPNS